jgi:NADPH2:quinone reductase
MKAIRVHEAGGPEVLRLEEIPAPVPGEGEVLVRIEAAGVNFIDVYQREGLYPLPRPYTAGSEGAGTVTAIGGRVTSVAVGDRVASASIRGAYAELAVVPADRLVRLPDGLGSRMAAALMLQGITAHYLATSTFPVKAGDTCLVHAAAGGVGLLLCQIASRRGARVIGTVSTTVKEALARDAGAAEIIRYTEQAFVPEVRRLTGGKGVHVVYDSVGRATFDGSLDSLARRGTLVLFGQSSGPVPPLDPQVLNRKGSLFLTRPTIAHYTFTQDELDGRAADLFRWVEGGTLHVHVDRAVPLADAAQAHRALEARETAGKVLLVP